MKRLTILALLALSLSPISASAVDSGSSSTPSPVITLPATPSNAPSAGNTPSAGNAPSFNTLLNEARKLIEAKNFALAIEALKQIDAKYSNSADVNNLLGYANRNLQKYPESSKYYAKALKLDPKHLGALEYQGELFLKTNKLRSAKANLAKLKKLCGTSCEEYIDLLKAIGKK